MEQVVFSRFDIKPIRPVLKYSLSRGLIRPVFIPGGFVGMKRLRIFLFPLDGYQFIARSCHSYCWYPFVLLG